MWWRADRADLGLITHFTVHELHRSACLTRSSEVIYACENPQVPQHLVAVGVDRTVACMSGNPAAGITLLARSMVGDHGDSDWPGIAIARRIFGLGAQPWRSGRVDYVTAVERLPADNRFGLTGRAQATP